MKAGISAALLLAASLHAGMPVVSTKAEAAPVSEGLLNDWLRRQSPAFETWDIGGQFRFRYEVKDDAGSFPSRDFISHGQHNDNDYFLFREKLHIGWQLVSWLRLYVEGRGAQAQSDDRKPNPDVDNIDLHQAFLEIGNGKDFPLSLKIGRQEMLYGDERFVGLSDWSNIGRSFDAAKVRVHLSDKSWIDIFSGRIVVVRDEYLNESNDYDQFSGIYASSKELVKGLETDAFIFARNVQAGSPDAIAPGLGGPSKREVYTYGVRVKSLPGAFNGWDFAFEGAGQFGDIMTNGVERDLQAYCLTGSLGYTFEKSWSEPRVGVGYDYGSGDSDPNDGHQETFEPLFGTNHRFYGAMDLVGLRNSNSPRVSVSFKPTKKLSVGIDYLLFWLADDNDSFYPESGTGRNANGYGRNPQFDSFVGSELDILAKYAVTPWAEIQLGYGHFFPGDYIKSSVGQVAANGGATEADWFYVQTSINF